MSASAKPDLEDPSWFSLWSCFCCRVDSSIYPLLAGDVLVGSSWSCGFILVKGSRKFWRDRFALESDVPGSCLTTSLFSNPLMYKAMGLS